MIFNTVIQGGGIKESVATGTVTATSTGSGADYTFRAEVTGLDFTPSHVMLTLTDINTSSQKARTAIGVFDTAGVSYNGNATMTLDLLENGFDVYISGSAAVTGQLNGTYTWVAWA